MGGQTVAGESSGEAISIVVPAYNEEQVLPEFHSRLAAVLDGLNLSSEIIYVNDGSRDGTLYQPAVIGTHFMESGPRRTPAEGRFQATEGRVLGPECGVAPCLRCGHPKFSPGGGAQRAVPDSRPVSRG